MVSATGSEWTSLHVSRCTRPMWIRTKRMCILCEERDSLQEHCLRNHFHPPLYMHILFPAVSDCISGSFQVFAHFLYTDKAAWTATETSVSFYLYKLYIYLLPKRGDCDKTYLQAPCSGVSPLLLLLSGSHCDSVIRYLTIGRCPFLNGIGTRTLSDDSITTLHQLKTKR